MECLFLNRTIIFFYIITTKEDSEKYVRVILRRSAEKYCFLKVHTYHTHKLTEARIICTRTRQLNSKNKWGKWFSSPTPYYKTIGCWLLLEKKEPLFLEYVATDRIGMLVLMPHPYTYTYE